MTKLIDIPEATVPALDPRPVLEIHRDPHGYIGLVRKPRPGCTILDKNGRPVQFENLCSIRAGDLAEMLPALQNYLLEDSYFTVNPYYRPAPYANKLTSLPDVWRKEKYLQSLAACYADCDVGREDSDNPLERQSWREAAYKAGIMADEGIIPQPSIMARSGRGVYLFWLLRDEKDSTALPHAWPEKIVLYKELNRALCQRVAELAPDVKAIDAARVLRFPGSVHTKAIRRVTYLIQVGDNGRTFTYTLPELARFLELPATAVELPDGTRRLALTVKWRKVKNPGSAPARKRGQQRLNARRAQDLLTVEQWRGGFRKRGERYQDGHGSQGRRFTLALYATWLKGAGESLEAAQAAVSRMAGNCRPPYGSSAEDSPSPAEIVQEIYAAPELRRWKRNKLCDTLGITPEVARELDLGSLVPEEVAQARVEIQEITAAAQAQARLAFVRDYLATVGSVRTCRAVARALCAAGLPTSHETANQLMAQAGCIQRTPGRQSKYALPVIPVGQ